MKGIVLAGLVSLALSGCGGPPPEKVSVCDKSQSYVGFISLPNGTGGIRMQPISETRCVQGHLEPNPAYKAWQERQ